VKVVAVARLPAGGDEHGIVWSGRRARRLVRGQLVPEDRYRRRKAG
jgi:hypothetical protein